MREMAGVRQSRLMDTLVRPVMKITFGLVHLSSRLELAILHQMSPSTVPVVKPIFLGIPPEHMEILTPSEARERYGYDKPTEAHLAYRERQRERAMRGEEPSVAAIAESEPVLGAVA
jgi:hypothetical protein